MGPIPGSRIREFGERYGLVEPTMSLFCRVLRSMDSAYLRWVTKEMEKLNRKGKKTGSPEEERE